MKDEINDKIIESMFKMLRALKGTMAGEVKASHLTMLQFEAMVCIKKFKKVSMGDIAEHFSTSMPTATSLVDKLLATKLVRRENDPKDRRIVKISLTKDGEKLLEGAMRQRKNKIHKFLSYLSREDKNELDRILNIIIAKAEIHEK